MTSTGPSEHIGTWGLLPANFCQILKPMSPPKFWKFRQSCSNDLLLYFGPFKFFELPPVLRIQYLKQDVISNQFFFMDIYLAVMNFFFESYFLFYTKMIFFSMMTILLMYLLFAFFFLNPHDLITYFFVTLNEKNKLMVFYFVHFSFCFVPCLFIFIIIFFQR